MTMAMRRLKVRVDMIKGRRLMSNVHILPYLSKGSQEIYDLDGVSTLATGGISYRWL